MLNHSVTLASVLTAVLAFTPVAFSQSTPVPALNRQAPSEPPAMAPAPTTSDVKGSIKMPQVMIVEPKNGATVSRTFVVKLAVEGMKLAKVNGGETTAGSGHHTLIVDGSFIEKGKMVPSDAKHIHLGGGESETKVTLSRGEHTLTVQFVDGSHASYGEMMSQSIKIKVK